MNNLIGDIRMKGRQKKMSRIEEIARGYPAWKEAQVKWVEKIEEDIMGHIGEGAKYYDLLIKSYMALSDANMKGLFGAEKYTRDLSKLLDDVCTPAEFTWSEIMNGIPVKIILDAAAYGHMAGERSMLYYNIVKYCVDTYSNPLPSLNRVFMEEKQLMLQ